MKQYNISYTWTGGERHISTDNFREFAAQVAALDEKLEQDDVHVIESTIKVETREMK